MRVLSDPTKVLPSSSGGYFGVVLILKPAFCMYGAPSAEIEPDGLQCDQKHSAFVLAQRNPQTAHGRKGSKCMGNLALIGTVGNQHILPMSKGA